MDETAQAKLEMAAERLEEPRDLACAYAGWLLTHGTFLSERDQLRAQREGRRGFPGFVHAPDEISNSALSNFLSRWQLSQLDSWELPAPQGPNLSGIGLPSGQEHASDRIRIELPTTTQLSERYGLTQIVREIRAAQTPEHLHEWRDVLDGDQGIGPGRWRHVFHLHFYRNISLQSRYLDRFKGRITALDRAMGKFLHIDANGIKKLRRVIRRRLDAGPSACHLA